MVDIKLLAALCDADHQMLSRRRLSELGFSREAVSAAAAHGYVATTGNEMWASVMLTIDGEARLNASAA